MRENAVHDPVAVADGSADNIDVLDRIVIGTVGRRIEKHGGRIACRVVDNRELAHRGIAADQVFSRIGAGKRTVDGDVVGALKADEPQVGCCTERSGYGPWRSKRLDKYRMPARDGIEGNVARLSRKVGDDVDGERPRNARDPRVDLLKDAARIGQGRIVAAGPDGIGSLHRRQYVGDGERGGRSVCDGGSDGI